MLLWYLLFFKLHSRLIKGTLLELTPFSYMALMAILTTFVVSMLLVKFRHRHIHVSSNNVTGIQDVHHGDVPRIGGVALFIGLAVAWVIAPKDLAEFLRPLFFCACPLFFIGFLEDITGKVSVGLRFIVSFASALLAKYLIGVGITQVGVLVVDGFLGTELGSYLFTAFAVAGIVNAINIVDGFNGLTASVVITVCLVFAYLAALSADDLMVQYSLLIAAVTLGFVLVNYPKGSLFLGDGGAYVLGFLVAWIAILVPHRSAIVSNWSSLLVLSYPVIEVLFTIYRRVKRRQHPGHPDRLHLHSLIYGRVICQYFPALPKYKKNALVMPIILIYMLLSEGLVLVFYNDKNSLIICFLGCAWVYNVLYRRLVFLNDL